MMDWQRSSDGPYVARPQKHKADQILNSEQGNIFLGTSKCSYIRYFKRAEEDNLKKINQSYGTLNYI